jgi:spore coat protein JB
MTTKSREQLMMCITEVSFALDDCVLFLDTHPCNKEAMEYYQNYRELRKQLMAEYRDCYGPISSYDVEDANVWTWVNDPWPWEGAC